MIITCNTAITETISTHTPEENQAMQNIKAAQHTNRPWNYTVAHKSIAVHPCHFYFEGNVDDSALADAALIAAAPELYEALVIAERFVAAEIALRNAESGEGTSTALDKIRAAIAKATA